MKISYSKATNKNIAATMEVGVAKVDITPQCPIRLSGFAARTKREADKVLRKLSAKAIAFGSDDQNKTILIAVEIIGIQSTVTRRVAEILSKAIGINPVQIAILVTHTHGSPEVGNLLNILQCRGDYPSEYFFNSSLLLPDELIHIAEFNEFLVKKLADVAIAAFNNRKPALVSWGKGKVSFAENRRTKGGPVDHSLPVLCIKNLDGSLRAIMANYACHGISLGPDINQIHGDWMGEAQNIIEERHPGCVAMIVIGCAGDLHPVRRDKVEFMKGYGKEIADEVDRVLSSNLVALNAPPMASMEWIKLPFAKVPTITWLIEKSKDTDIRGYYSRLALERILRGESLPKELNYPIQILNFDNRMAMINLGGEAVVDYAYLFKEKYGDERIWINSYANDVSCYIPSLRILKEGGYEGETSMYWYNQPSPFAEIIEQKVAGKVNRLMPSSFRHKSISAQGTKFPVDITN